MTHPARRHLSCIMFTDMVGYSAFAQRAESVALELVAEQRTLFRPIFTEHGGEEIKSTGDGFLVEFASARDATRCAVELQRAMVERNASVPADRRFQVRVGLHLGDIEVQEGDVFGDGVNLAARIQQCAPSGGVCVSEAVAEQVRNKLEHPLEPMGARRLKHIAAPVELYRVVLPWERRSRDHLAHVSKVLLVAPLHLGERLSVEIEMVEIDPPFSRNERAAILPACGNGNEIVRRSELDIDSKIVLECGESAEDRILRRDDLEIDVNRAASPPV